MKVVREIMSGATDHCVETLNEAIRLADDLGAREVSIILVDGDGDNHIIHSLGTDLMKMIQILEIQKLQLFISLDKE